MKILAQVLVDSGHEPNRSSAMRFFDTTLTFQPLQQCFGGKGFGGQASCPQHGVEVAGGEVVELGEAVLPLGGVGGFTPRLF